MTRNARTMVIGAVVGAVTLLAYAGALSCGFINLDDPFYITGNPLIRSLDPAALVRLFTQSHLAAWLPLTYLSFALDFHFWGDNPLGYHLTNIILHGVNGVLVVFLADRFCGDRLATGTAAGRGGRLHGGMLLLAGLLFSLHPLRVESVAWAAERKDVLNGLFTLSSLLAYSRYVRLRDAGEGGRGAYLTGLVLFCLSLLAKQVSVTLPVILLLLDWHPLGRLHRGNIRQRVWEKVPFFLVSLAITLVTIGFAAAEKSLITLASMPLLVRTVVSGNALFEYVRLSLFPVGISPYFVLPKPLPYGYPVKAAVVIVVSLLLLRYAGRLRGVTAGWFCFVIAMAPMLAFVQAGDDIALAARYTYLPAIVPTIGCAVLLTRQLGRWLERGDRGRAALAGTLVLLALLGAAGATMRLIPVWRDTGTFWSRVIDIEPVGRAYGDRGVFYLIAGRSDAAERDFTTAIETARVTNLPSLYNLYAFRGVALSDVGRYDAAVADFDRAIALFPHPTYYQLRGEALSKLGRSAEAAADFRRAGPDPPPIDWFTREPDRGETGPLRGRRR